MESIDLTHSFPSRIPSQFEMQEVNKPVLLFEGPLTLETTIPERTIPIEGRLLFRWYPTKGGVLIGRIQAEDQINLRQFEFTMDNIITISNGTDVIGQGFAQRLSSSTADVPQEIEVIMTSSCFLGDESIEVTEFKFVLPNFIKLPRPNPVNDGPGSWHAARTTIEDDEVIIDLDMAKDYTAIERKLKYSSGYHITHVGRVISKDSKVVWNGKSVGKLIEDLTRLFTLIKGRKIAPQIISGVHDEVSHWTDYHGNSMQAYKNVIRWAPDNDQLSTSNLWRNIRVFASSKENAQFLDFALEWYTEANDTSTGLDSAIVKAQIVLELLYNWIVIEKSQIMRGDDADKIQAANKIRILLSILKINDTTPQSLSFLRQYIHSDNELNDGVDAIVRVRNSVVHPKTKKIETRLNIDANVMHEIWLLSLYFVEMGILWSIGYKGEFVNRTLITEGFLNNRVSPVPWI